MWQNNIKHRRVYCGNSVFLKIVPYQLLLVLSELIKEKNGRIRNTAKNRWMVGGRAL